MMVVLIAIGVFFTVVFFTYILIILMEEFPGLFIGGFLSAFILLFLWLGISFLQWKILTLNGFYFRGLIIIWLLMTLLLSFIFRDGV